MSPTTTALAAIVAPLIGAVAILVTGRRPNIRETMTLLAAVATFSLVASLLPGVLAKGFWSGPIAQVDLIEVVGGLTLSFHVEPLGLVYALIASSLWIVNSVYAIGYMRGNHEKNQTRFFTCIAIAIACAVGAAFSANLFTLFVCYEALSLSTVPLVTHKGTEDAKRAGRTYLGILVGTSVCFFLLGIIAVGVLTDGDLGFKQGGVLAPYLAAGGSTAIVGLLFALFMYGIGKAALMPVHRWLPAAMVAPTPVSALLHAVAVVKCGVFAVLKVTVYTFGPETLGSLGNTGWLIYAACFTIVCASGIAAFQDNFKRRLAYSTISQLGYIVLAAGLAAQGGAAGALAAAAGAMHIIAHAFGKITLFYTAGNVYTAHHLTEISQLDGIGKKMPVTFAAFAVGAVSMIGVPPTAGFLSKWSLVGAAWSAEAWIAVATLVISTLLNAIYLLEVPYRAFLRKPPAAPAHHHGHGDDGHDDEAPWPMRLAIVTTAVMSVLLFLGAGWVTRLVGQLAEGVR